MIKNMNDIYNQMTKGQLSSSIKCLERKIDQQPTEKLYTTLENQIQIYVQRFEELPKG